jgi:hypothetical protein
VLQALFNAGVITWGWQTYAWSGGAWESRAHIQQYQNGVVLAGHSVDYNRSIKSDFGQWLEGQEVEIVISIQTPGVANFFTEMDAQHWICKQTGKVLKYAILDWYKRFGNAALCGLTWLGLPQSNEIPLVGSKHGAVKVHCENGVIFYDPAHEFDARPGTNDAIYLGHLYSGQGQDPAIAILEARLAAAQKPTGLDANVVANRLTAIGLEAQKVVTLTTQPF